MPDYELSKKADEDLTVIYIFSFQHFGEQRADAYLLSLAECFSLLAENPQLGRKIDHVRKDYFQHEHASHTVFYKTKKNGIRVMRVLHQRMESIDHL
jgi:toxin ParE1/3/4